MGTLYQPTARATLGTLNRIGRMSLNKEHWVLTFICPDRPGIVHAISGAVVQAGGNITESQQYTSEDTGRFFIRLQIEADITKADFEQRFESIATEYQIEYVHDIFGRKMKKILLLGSGELGKEFTSSEVASSTFTTPFCRASKELTRMLRLTHAA